MNSIIIKPLITEQSLRAASVGIFTFAVDFRANKSEISTAIKSLFHVHPTSVHTLIVKGKTRRNLKSHQMTRVSPWKKAVIKLKPGEKIDLFDFGEGGNA